MANVRIVLNRNGPRELRKEPGVVREVTRIAEKIAADAGPGHRVETEIGRNRARAVVITDTTEAALAEATDHNLTRAFDAAR